MDGKTARRFIVGLADRHQKELGFLPMSVLDALFTAGHVIVPQLNNDPIGYLIRSKIKRRTKIWQTCIRADARRCTFGSQTLATVIEEATENDVHRLSLHCAADLDACKFWAANGFVAAGTRVKNKRTRRLQIRYELLLPAGEAHYAALNTDGREPLRERLIDLLALQGAQQKQVDKFKRRRYS